MCYCHQCCTSFQLFNCYLGNLQGHITQHNVWYMQKDCHLVFMLSDLCCVVFFIKYHRFPADETRRDAWVKAVRRVNINTKREWLPSKWSVLCSCHFEASSFRSDRGNTYLKADAVPTLFNYPESVVSCVFLILA